jgi:sterol 3beta-glucosyltransferase
LACSWRVRLADERLKGWSQPDALAALVCEAAAKSNSRMVIATGWGGPAACFSPGVFVVESVPHDWMFERVESIVHHGGAGTTAAALRAGVPSFFADQPFWGAVCHELRVSPRPIPRRKLTSERLARAIDMMQADHLMRARAQDLAQSIRAEDGVAAAVNLIEMAMCRMRRGEE